MLKQYPNYIERKRASSMENVCRVFQTFDIKTGIKDFHNNLVKVE